LRIFADVVVFLDDDAATARARKDRLDELNGRPYRSDAFVYAGTPAGLADLLLEWHSAGMTGFRLRPGALPHDLLAVTEGLVGVLQDLSAFRTRYEDATLRERLGLPRPTNMYATT
jgi:alkanesulfonate monooxygenase SsuD/methylene tetrahydromethanopterin reductase-like flavin-dependent oxidoreductase (luciferase family)